MAPRAQRPRNIHEKAASLGAHFRSSQATGGCLDGNIKTKSLVSKSTTMTPKFFDNVLTPRQKSLLQRLGPVMNKRGFYLGGGIAVALYLGHRFSRDFDWF